MTDTWAFTEIGNIAEIYDGPHATPSKTVAGPVFLGISNLVDGRIDLSTTQHLSEEDFSKWTRRVTPRPEDIVFSYETRLGQAALIPNGLRCCLGRRMGLLRIKSGLAVPRFVLYAYLGPNFQEVIRRRTIHGSTVDRIPLIDLPSFQIRLPGILQQRAIAHILGTLDDKIELNRRMNQTLEEMARALFKSWFVDFDPVRAKAEGREPVGMDAETAALFPDAFEESELGLIPEGWSVGSFADMSSLNPEVWRKSTAPETIHYLDLSGVKWGVASPPKDFLFEDAPSRARRILRAGDTVIGTVRPANGSYALIEDPPSNLTGSTGFAVLRPRRSEHRYFNYLNATQREFIDYLASVAHGSAYPAVAPEVIYESRIVMPPEGILQRFDSLMEPSFSRVRSNDIEADTLSTIRDTLLPKLLSGDLRIDDPEEFLKENVP